MSTGSEEIWLTDIAGSQRSKLTNFKDSRHYVDLKWSPDGKIVMALTLNEIHIINTKTGDFERLKIPQTEIRGISFKTNNVVAYSTNQNNQWRVSHYHLDTHTVTLAAVRWQFIQYTSDAENTLWFDQNKSVYWGKEPTAVVSFILVNQAPLNGRTFNIKKFGQQWVWLEWDGGYKLMSLLGGSDKSIVLLQTEVGHFDLLKGRVLYNVSNRDGADIYIKHSQNCNNYVICNWSSNY